LSSFNINKGKLLFSAAIQGFVVRKAKAIAKLASNEKRTFV
jgi:hypothetical protein